jgi:hypothetical protein
MPSLLTHPNSKKSTGDLVLHYTILSGPCVNKDFNFDQNLGIFLEVAFNESLKAAIELKKETNKS